MSFLNYLRFIFLFIVLFLHLSQALGQCKPTITASNNGLLCKGGSVKLTSVEGTNYLWLHDGQEIPGATSIEHTATLPGKYKVKVKLSDPACTDISDDFEVKEVDLPATPNFNFSPSALQCSGTPIIFSVDSPNPGVTYSWDFGDGGKGEGNSVSHTFSFIGSGTKTFSITVTGKNNNNCISVSTTQNVTIKAAPDLLIEDSGNPFEPFSNCAKNPSVSNPNYDLEITNTSNHKGDITNYIIDWGDGSSKTTSSFTTEKHTYTKLGQFNLKVTATSINGCTTIKEQKVVNQSNPAVGLASFGSTQGCAPLPLEFQLSKYKDNSPGTYYVWNFGDGSPEITWSYDDPFNNDIIKHTFRKTTCDEVDNECNTSIALDHFSGVLNWIRRPF